MVISQINEIFLDFNIAIDDKQFFSKRNKIGPMFINNTNINVPIPHLLNPKLSLYDFHRPSYKKFTLRMKYKYKNGRGQKYVPAGHKYCFPPILYVHAWFSTFSTKMRLTSVWINIFR